MPKRVCGDYVWSQRGERTLFNLFQGGNFSCDRVSAISVLHKFIKLDNNRPN